jgi:predicted RNA-binding Zn-ribbon protein involved in translation (DUF1610 family)
MDFQIIFIAALIIVYGLSIYIKKTLVPKIKGTFGEQKVSRKLKRLNKKEFKVLNDVLLANGNSTSQIDHIVISRTGIFVIETKNYKGWIHGHEKSEYWTQSIYSHKIKLRNPIKQNWAHVYVLKKILSEYNFIKYFPIVVFVGNAKLKNITSKIPVIYTRQLLKTIKSNTEVQNLSIEQINDITDKLNQLNIGRKKEFRRHVKRIKKQTIERRKKEVSKICPKCGGKLVVKKGRYGKFYGCSNFPKCTYTLNINRI